MKKSALTVTVGVLLIIYALINFGSGYAQFTKATMADGAGSAFSGLASFAGDSASAGRMQSSASSISMGMRVIGLFILATAVLQIVASIGLFSGKHWAFAIVVVAAICGIIIEIQDLIEDGFSIWLAVFLGINALALFAAFSARESKTVTA